ncbi:MAG: hypothetical protein AAF357_19015, partial [Verrucomicrobiota bacterium]
YGVWPEQIPDFLALAGDSVDNIPGVPCCIPFVFHNGNAMWTYPPESVLPFDRLATISTSKACHPLREAHLRLKFDG